ncbi:MAG: AMP-binding protein, partial [Chloroflexi bacterium]|nr:AMP-binding protein [Chloroflexota bacterium]
MNNIEYNSEIVQNYPLVPMQHGMLFNSLYHPQHGLDLTHFVYDLPENIVYDTLKTAWQQCVNQHEIFRSSFQWSGIERPVQHVHATAVLPFAYEDWSSLSTAAQAKKLTAFLRKDRKRGFDFHTPPLMRCALFKISNRLYRFVWTFHHSIIDGRASSLVLYEAFTRYEALLNGEEFPTETAVPFQKYVNWLYAQDWHVAEPFWRKRLAGFTQTTPIPPDPDGEPDVQAGDPACELKLYLSAETTANLHTITQQHSITFNTMIQGAWGLLLHHYTNSNDIVFGTVRACRRSAFVGTENIIGQLINSVPIRVNITSDTPTVMWLESLREQWNSIRPFEHIPYTQIKMWSDLPKGTPLFETTALYDHATVGTRLKALGGKWADRDIEIFFKTDSPISLYAHGGDRMLLSIYYDRAKYRDATVARMLNQLEQIFTAFATNVQQPINKIGILSPAEQHTIIHEWNNTHADISNELCLHTRITQHAKSHPTNIAVDDGQTQLTYVQLEQQANQLAHYLIQQGVTRETPIGICYGRSHHFIIAILAILKAGGVYVPLDPTFPAKRLNFIQVDAQLPLIITHKQMAGLTCPQLICWSDAAPPIFHQMPTTAPKIQAEINQPAYMIYTSGSTGQPKGVLCHHRGVVNLLDDFNKRSPLVHDTQHSLWTNITFDVSVYEIFSALTTGGTLHIVPN